MTLSTTKNAEPAKYSPPAELLEKAAKELQHAVPEEVAGAQRAYEAYNAAVGGRSAATGAPLPTWENNPNALVRYGWLQVYREGQDKALREVDKACAVLQESRKEWLEKVLGDPRLSGLFSPGWLAVLRRLAQHNAPEVPGMLVWALLSSAHDSFSRMCKTEEAVEKAWGDAELDPLFDPDFLKLARRKAKEDSPTAVKYLYEALVSTLVSHARLEKKREAKMVDGAKIATELAELRLCVGAVHNTLANNGAITTAHARLLEAAAMKLESAGFKASGDFLRACAAGAFECEEPKA